MMDDMEQEVGIGAQDVKIQLELRPAHLRGVDDLEGDHVAGSGAGDGPER